MKEDEYGELHPVIDTIKCIECGQCQIHCPNNVKMKYNKPKKVYAAVRHNKKELKRCAAGGVASLIMDSCYKQGWSVYAARWDSDFQCVHKKLGAESEVEAFKGSRYVQSYIGNSYLNVKKELELGKSVLFIGTPCQCAGLKTFLNGNVTNLVVIDLVCHGVCSQRYLNEELEYLTKGKQKDNVTFRGYGLKEDQHFCIWNDGQIILNHPGEIDYYMKAYSDGVTLRESCYQCHYAIQQRVGDITLGDFHGLDNSIHSDFKKNCVNVVLLNTEKGIEIFKSIAEDLLLIERTIDEAVRGNRCLQKPWFRHKKQKIFRRRLKKDSFPKAIRKTLKKEMIVAFGNKVIKYIKIRLGYGLS
jgi:coenzyme F420-reducing hydrogenase beta subunit